MNWTEVNIYTETEGIDILCASLMDIGIKGFVIKDSNDFKEFLENKNGKWDYIDDDLMNLSNCETCLTVYLPDNSQGMEMMISLKTLLKQMIISGIITERKDEVVNAVVHAGFEVIDTAEGEGWAAVKLKAI